MRPTTPHLSSSSPDFRAYARMQASTASACLRKLSDWANSVSKPHAESRSFMVSYLFSPGFCLVTLLYYVRFCFCVAISLDIYRHPPADYAADYNLTEFRQQGVASALATPTI